MAEKQWIRKNADSNCLASLKNSGLARDLSPLMLRLLAQRGFKDEDKAIQFLHPRLKDLTDPFLLPEMDKAVPRILQAVDSGEKVVIYGDYDVDGVTSVTIMSKVLRAYGLEPDLFLPHRIEEGYGISKDGIGRVLKNFKPTLMIALDCGTSSQKEVALLNENGVDVIVCDHHECNPGSRPDCVALVNPKLGDEFHYLCSAGVAFKVAHALLKTRMLPEFQLRDLMDIVALGTVADIVPLVGENRIFVRRGLLQMERTQNAGLAAIKSAAGIDSPMSSMDIGFKIGPRLNAAGRLDHAQVALDLLLAKDDDEAKMIAEELDACNKERQQVEQRIREEAIAMIEATEDVDSVPAFVIGSRGWHPGVVGIVASRIVQQYHRPTFVIAIDDDGVGKGSGRSVESVSLVNAINQCREHLLQGGGHDMAAGLAVHEDQLDTFREKFIACIRESATEEALVPRLMIDAETRFRDINLDLLDSYELLQPFGCENPQPVFAAKGIQLLSQPRVLSEKHLKLEMVQGAFRCDAVYFNAADVDLPRTPWDVAFTIERNNFKGKVNVQLIIQAIRTSVENG